jgi:RNA polymerase sigma-70 factor (ECF subfamily)
MRVLTDGELVQRIVGKDQEALALLYDRYAGPVYGLALRILGEASDAEEVVQDVFAQAWQQAARYQPERGVVPSWLLNMARSRAIDRRRARAIRSPARPVAPPAGADGLAASTDPEADALTIERARAVRRALDALPTIQRLAIELAYFEGLSQSEIANRLEEPLGTVKTRIRLGMLKLRGALRPYGTGAAP